MEIEPVINLLGTYKKYKYIADEYGVSFSTFERRMRDNYTLEEAFTSPLHKMTNRPDYSKQAHRYNQKKRVSKEQVILNKLNLGIMPNKKEQAYMLEHKDKFKEWLR